MKKTVILLLLLLTLSCTQNNGHIGPLFGSWTLESLTIDGVADTSFEPGHTFWEFQGNIVAITRTFDHYDKYNSYGTWSRQGDTLTLYYNHHDNDSAEGEPPYQAPGWLHFPASGIFHFDIIKLTSSQMTLSRTDEEGITYVFQFKKIW